MKTVDKVKILGYLKVRLKSKSLQIDRLVKEGSDDSSCVCEWGIYNKIITELEKGTFDIISEPTHTNDPDETCFCEKCLRADRGGT